MVFTDVLQSFVLLGAGLAAVLVAAVAPDETVISLTLSLSITVDTPIYTTGRRECS